MSEILHPLLRYATLVTTALILGQLLGGSSTARAQRRPADVAAEVGIDQHLGRALPDDLEFTDERGRRVRLTELTGERPAILALVYYECPMLCTQVLNGLTKALRTMSLEPGRDFDVVAVSIDPGETPELAAAKKREYVERYGRPGSAAGWHFLTGDAQAVEALAAAVGFRYVYDESSDNYAHASGVMVLTPEGELARYFYGIQYPPRDLRLGLVEAGRGGIGSATDRLLLLCYRYDPTTGRYGFVVWSAVRLAGVATALALCAFVIVMLRRERSGGADADASGGGS